MITKSDREKVALYCASVKSNVLEYLLALLDIGRMKAGDIFTISRSMRKEALEEYSKLNKMVSTNPLGLNSLRPITIFGIPRIWLDKDNIQIHGIPNYADKDNETAAKWIISKILPSIQSKEGKDKIAKIIFDIIRPDEAKDTWIKRFLSKVEKFSKELYGEAKSVDKTKDNSDENKDKIGNKNEPVNEDAGSEERSTRAEESESSEEDNRLQEVQPGKEKKDSSSRRRKSKS